MKQFIENIERGLEYPSASVVIALILFVLTVCTLTCAIGVMLFGPIGFFLAPVTFSICRLGWLGFKGK